MKEHTNTRIENERRWKDHIARSQSFPGPLTEYCREAGISIHSMNYWRKRLSGRARVLPVRSAFAAVEVLDPIVPSRGRRLPDPKWVAELILHLGGDCR